MAVMTTTVSYIALVCSCIVSIVSIALSWGKMSTKLDLIEKDTKLIEKNSQDNQNAVTKAQEAMSKKLESTTIKLDDLLKNTTDVKEKLIKLESELNGIQNVSQLKFNNLETKVQTLESRFEESVRRHGDEIKEARHIAKDALSAISLFRAERVRIKKKAENEKDKITKRVASRY
jgi:phage-related minor tail protein